MCVGVVWVRAGPETLHSNKRQGRTKLLVPAHSFISSLCHVPTTSRSGPKVMCHPPQPIPPPSHCLEGTDSRSYRCSWDDHLPGVSMRKVGSPLRMPNCFVSVPEKELCKQGTHRGQGGVGWGWGRALDNFPLPWLSPLRP